MAQQNLPYSDDRERRGKERYATSTRIVAAPVASPGIRDALRAAFACERETTGEFHRLLIKIR